MGSGEGIGFFDPSDQDLDRFMDQYGNEDGTYDAEAFEKFMSGELELADSTDDDTVDATAEGQEGEEAEASSASEEQRAPQLDDTEPTGKEAEDQDAEPEEGADATGDPPEPVVQAKDGEHTIPYSVLEELRTEVSSLKEQNTELKELLEADPEVEEQVNEAIAEAQESGTDLAGAEIFADLEEDFPGIGERLQKSLIEPMQAALTKLSQIDTLVEDKQSRDADTARAEAQREFEADIARIDDRYQATIADDRFWEWFDKQPAFYQASMKSSDPSHFASIVTQWNDDVLPGMEQEAEKAADPPAEQPKAPTKEEVAEKAEAAAKEAASKDGVESLTDVPGSSDSPDDMEANAMTSISSQDLAEQFLNLDPDAIEGKLTKVL